MKINRVVFLIRMRAQRRSAADHSLIGVVGTRMRVKVNENK
jgi:hypothetical protein